MAADRLTEQITNLEYSYARCIDDDRLEEWPDFFVEDGVYKIVPRENSDRGMPLAIMLCKNKNMLEDRVAALRHANMYNIHFDRHMVSNIQVLGEADGVYQVAANYVVFQTDLEGATKLFSAGRYDDRVVVVNGELKFSEKIVVVDTYAVPNLIATPL